MKMHEFIRKIPQLDAFKALRSLILLSAAKQQLFSVRDNQIGHYQMFTGLFAVFWVQFPATSPVIATVFTKKLLKTQFHSLPPACKHAVRESYQINLPY